MGIWNRITKPNFWDNVVKQDGDGCWEWKAAYLGKGYGAWRPTPGHRPLGAHRVAYELTHGPIPVGPPRLCVCHRCDNPPCVRPDHLFLGTYTANHHDMKAKGRAPVGDRHGRRVLNSGEVREVLEAYARGDVTMKALGARYGVTWGAIRFIVYGITWKDVPGPRLSHVSDVLHVVELGKRATLDTAAILAAHRRRRARWERERELSERDRLVAKFGLPKGMGESKRT